MDHRDEILELFRRAASDREHGAAAIEESLIRSLLDHRAGLRVETIRQGARELVAGQPAMANLRSLAAHADSAGSEAEFATWLVRRAETLEQLPERLADNAWPRIEVSERVVTASRSTAVAAVLEGAWARGWGGQAVVLDGTVAGRGRDQARHLAASGPTVSQPDGAAPSWLDEAATVVVVGADAVGARLFVNCTGTRSLLELARERGVETVLVADSGKDVDDEVIDEIVRLSPRHRESPDREWPIFEAVPLDLVTTRVAE